MFVIVTVLLQRIFKAQIKCVFYSRIKFFFIIEHMDQMHWG